MARLFADENFPFPVVEALRRMGHDVVTVVDAGKAGQALTDTVILQLAGSQQRAVGDPYRPFGRGAGINGRSPDARESACGLSNRRFVSNMSPNPRPGVDCPGCQRAFQGPMVGLVTDDVAFRQPVAFLT